MMLELLDFLCQSLRINKRALLKAITCLAILLMHASTSLAGGTVEQVRQALEDGADVNARDADGFTPLMLAVGARRETDSNAEMVRLLIRHGADVHAEYVFEPYLGMTALHWAVLRLPEAVSDLLDAGADIDALSSRGTPLMLAVREIARAPELYKLLLRRGADVNIEHSPLGNAFSWALFLSRITPEVLISLLDAGAEIPRYVVYEPTLMQLIFSPVSAVRNSIPVMKRILDSGVDVNAVGSMGETAILSAMRQGVSIETLNFLIYNGANTRAIDNSGRTIWHYAAWYLHRFYDFSWADLSYSDLPWHSYLLWRLNLLHHSQLSWHFPWPYGAPREMINEDTLAILKASGISVNQADNAGVTPLMLAAQYGTREAVGLLIRAGADTTQRDFAGRSAYDHARYNLRSYNADLIFFNGSWFQFYLARVFYILYLIAYVLMFAACLFHFKKDISSSFAMKIIGTVGSFFCVIVFLVSPIRFPIRSILSSNALISAAILSCIYIREKRFPEETTVFKKDEPVALYLLTANFAIFLWTFRW